MNTAEITRSWKKLQHAHAEFAQAFERYFQGETLPAQLAALKTMREAFARAFPDGGRTNDHVPAPAFKDLDDVAALTHRLLKLGGPQTIGPLYASVKGKGVDFRRLGVADRPQTLGLMMRHRPKLFAARGPRGKRKWRAAAK